MAPGPLPYENFYDTSTDMQDVLGNARASMGTNSLKSLQQELRNLQYEYAKVRDDTLLSIPY